MRFRNILSASLCAALLIFCGGSFAQDKDISALVDEGTERAKAFDIAPVESNEDLINAARDRIKTWNIENVEMAPVGDIFGYDYEAEIERQLNVLEDPTLYIFVSFSMEDSLTADYVREASLAGGIVVIGGLHNDSFKQTVDKVASFIQTESGEVNGGVIIDPKSFETFGVTRVPTIILAQAPLSKCLSSDCLRDVPIHDRVEGSVSLEYALKLFASDGDLKEAASQKLSKVSKDIYSAYRE